jgi:GcrA cell cycle regulator
MPCSANDFDWNAHSIAQLRALWAEGHTTTEIGRRMGVSKNAITGYPQRSSTLYQLPAVAVEVRKAQQDAAQSAPIVREAVPVCTVIRGNKPCCWPIGEPGTRAFRYCEAPSEASKPYCPHHCGIAYQKKDQRQKAA